MATWVTRITNVTNVVVPDWVSNSKKEITALTGASEVLLRLAGNPKGFIIGHILDFFVQSALRASASFAVLIADLQRMSRNALVDALSAAFGPVGEEVGALILELVDMANGLTLELARGTGPVAPFVQLLIWVVVMYAAIYGFVYGIKLLLVVIDLITGRVPDL